MSDLMIKVENLGKKYIISHEGSKSYTAMRDVIAGKAKRILRNNRNIQPAKEEFWALKDVSFEIQKGEAVGIIGRNGAGKSTLLKLLSRITEPTKGRIEINGRVASLLEVGTGFHPELTGRENIFLNGAILGMSRAEIRKKFDEMVDFSGVEKFLDTPVKRFSSGMYVRLAFSVAAHLEPEILVIDEVLAVGDAEFQKKCLGKMDEVSNSGRTVIFVSHDMVAIRTLCKNAIALEKGQITCVGEVNKVIENYSEKGPKEITFQKWEDGKEIGSGSVRIKELSVYDNVDRNNQIFDVETEIRIDTTILCLQSIKFNLSVVLYKSNGECIFNSGSSSTLIKEGLHTYSFVIPSNFLNDGNYYLSFYLIKDAAEVVFRKDELLSFEIKDTIRDGFWTGKWLGAVRPKLEWIVTHK
jgi:lipopolysaccharide transport system ATP-binding protein